jgi:hypothetical protein
MGGEDDEVVFLVADSDSEQRGRIVVGIDTAALTGSAMNTPKGPSGSGPTSGRLPR